MPHINVYKERVVQKDFINFGSFNMLIKLCVVTVNNITEA